MKEQWKQVVGFGNWYEVSDKGNVRSYRTQGTGARRKLPVMLSGGFYRRINHSFAPYHYVLLRDENGKKVNKNICRLVLEAFVGQAPVGKEVSHLNGNPLDNRLKNLAWETHRENMARWDKRFVKGQRYTAEQVKKWIAKRGARKINPERVREIRSLLEEGHSIRKLACRFDVAHQTIYNISRKATWKNVA